MICGFSSLVRNTWFFMLLKSLFVILFDENQPSLTLRLQAPPIFTGRLTEVLGAVAAEIAQRGEVHAVGDLGEREALVIQKAFQDGYSGTVDVTADAVARHAFDCGGEVLRRDV